MTFKFTYNDKAYDVALTNQLIIDVEENCGKPVQHLWHVHRGQEQIMRINKMGIYAAVLTHLGVLNNEPELCVSIRQIMNRDDIHWNSGDVVDNCIGFINAFLQQESEFLKLKGKEKADKETKKK